MSIEDMKVFSINDLKQINLTDSVQNNQSTSCWKIGEKYFIRTVTMHLVGRLVSIHGSSLIFEDGAWIADDGRFNNMLKTGEFGEVEPFLDPVGANSEAFIDWTIWRHALPREVK